MTHFQFSNYMIVFLILAETQEALRKGLWGSLHPPETDIVCTNFLMDPNKRFLDGHVVLRSDMPDPSLTL